jgi:hypothetical protein
MRVHHHLAPAAALLLGCRSPAPVALRPEVRLPTLPDTLGPEGGTVVGVVADSALGFPVIGAAVYFTADTVVGIGFPTPLPDLPADSTDGRGGFLLRGIPPGARTLVVRDVGYRTHRQVVVVHAGVADTLVVRLQGTLVPPP